MGEFGAWSYIIVSFLATLGLLFSSVLFFSKNNTLPSKCLAAVIFCYSFIGINYGLISTNFFLKFPQFWRAPAPISLLLPIFSYKYVTSVLKQQYRFSGWDALWLVLPVLYCFNFYPFFILTSDEKIKIISIMLENKKMISREVEGMLPPGFGIRFRLACGVMFSLVQFYHLYNYKKNNLTNSALLIQNAQIYRWLIYFTFVIFFSYAFVILWQSFQLNSNDDFFISMTFTIVGSILFICLYLIVKPNILYGLAGWTSDLKDRVENVDHLNSAGMVRKVDAGNLTFSLEEGNDFHNIIDEYLKNNHPFIKQGYKIKDLSLEIGLPVYILSAFINQAYGKNFNEFINDHRVDYIENIIKSNSDADNLTLEAIAKSAGFNSRTSFIAAVKRKTGKTPSEYFQSTRLG